MKRKRERRSLKDLLLALQEAAAESRPAKWLIETFPFLTDPVIQYTLKKAQRSGGYGDPLPRLSGKFRARGSIIWCTDIIPYYPDSDPDSTESSADSGNDDPNMGHYYASFAVAFAGNQQSKLLRVWANGRLIIDKTPGGFLQVPPLYADCCRFYPGSSAQTADPHILAEEGSAPAYRGTCYLVFEKLPLRAFGDDIPEIEAEFASGSLADYTEVGIAGLSISAGNIDNFVVSHTTPLLYAFSGGVISVVNRNDATLTGSRDLAPLLSAISGTAAFNSNGRIVLDESRVGLFEPVYLFCQDGGASFIAAWGGPLVGLVSNYASRIAGGDETDGFVSGDYLFTVDRTSYQIRCYNKLTLERLWTRAGVASGGTPVPGTFTRDHLGRIWLCGYDDSDPDIFYLSRITTGGTLQHYSFAGDGEARCVAFDTVQQKLVVGGGSTGELHRLSCPAAGSPVLEETLAARSGTNQRALFLSQFRFSGSFWSCDNSTFYEIRTSDFTQLQSIDISNFMSPAGFGGFAFTKPDLSFWALKSTSTYGYRFPLDRWTSDPPTLATILSELCQQAGLSTSEIDVDALSGVSVDGYAVLDRSDAVSALQPLIDAHLLDVREHFENGYSNIKLEFIQRGGASVVTIPEEDLGAYDVDGSPPDVPLTEEREDEADLPRRVIVHHVDAAQDYAESQQKAEWEIDSIAARAEHEMNLSSLVLSVDVAKQLAQKKLDALFIERELKRFTLPPKYLYLEAGDAVTITYNGGTTRVRLTSVELGANWILDCVGVVEDASVYTQSGTGAPGPNPNQNPTLQIPVRVFLLDIPIVRDEDDDPGFYAGVGPLLPATFFLGALLRRSEDGAQYAPIKGFNAGVVWGTTTIALADGDTEGWDYTTTLTVQMIFGTPTTATQAELVASRLKNLCAVGDEVNGWELLQFATVTSLGGGAYQLTNLLRGRFGTEWKTGAHIVGEQFILLDFETPTIKRIKMPLGDLTQEYYYRAPAFDAPLSASAPQLFANQGVGLKPYSVTQVALGDYNWPSPRDFAFVFLRRSRVGTVLQDSVDAYLGEDEERYEVDILDGSGGAVKRTITIGPGLPVVSGVNLSVDTGGQTITRASGSFIDDGLFPGQWFEGSGFSNAANNRRNKISSLTATVITIDTEAATTPLVTEASAAGRTITAVTPAFGYTDAMQDEDFGAPVGDVYFRVYQISKDLDTAGINNGRGYSDQEYHFTN